jgi:hypothetical protein
VNNSERSDAGTCNHAGNYSHQSTAFLEDVRKTVESERLTRAVIGSGKFSAKKKESRL